METTRAIYTIGTSEHWLDYRELQTYQSFNELRENQMQSNTANTMTPLTQQSLRDFISELSSNGDRLNIRYEPSFSVRNGYSNEITMSTEELLETSDAIFTRIWKSGNYSKSIPSMNVLRIRAQQLKLI